MQQDPTIPQNPGQSSPPPVIGGPNEGINQPPIQPQASPANPQQSTTPPVEPTQPVASPAQPAASHNLSTDTPLRPKSPVINNVQKKSKDGWKSALSTIMILIAAPLLAITLTTFVFQSYEVDGESMETTLQNNDRLIVWKVPVTLSKLKSGPYQPERGEIVVFHRHGMGSGGGSGDKQLIKRVLGLPGERVVVRDNQITIYNQERPEGFNPDSPDYGERTQVTPGNVDLTVPKNEIFVVGDNRNNSLDSRAFGTISLNDVVGELGARIFPFDKARTY